MPEVSSFDFARLAALKQYADLENHLVGILRYALGGDHLAAKTVFFQIVSTSVRYRIIANLLRERDEGAFYRAWKWIEKRIGHCDIARNELVHWSERSIPTLTVSQDGDNLSVSEINLISALQNPKSTANESPIIREADIWKKRDQMRVMLHIVNRFSLTLKSEEMWPWRDLFQQPITCDDPAAFLKVLNDAGHPAELPPFEKKILPLYKT